METKSEDRRSSCFDPSYIYVALGAAFVILVTALLGKGHPRGSGVRIGLAVVQALASSVVILMPWWGMSRLDELQQRIQLEALAIAFFGTCLLGTTYGFLENAGLPQIDWGAAIWPAMVVLWAVGIAIASRRYR